MPGSCQGFKQSGFTLIELVLVVAILAIIALLVVTRVDRFKMQAQTTVAEADLKCLRDALMDDSTGYLSDMSSIPGFSVGHLRIGNLLTSTNLYGEVSERAENGSVSCISDGCRLDDPDDLWAKENGAAAPSAFTTWDTEAGRGWRGPYVKVWNGVFPARAIAGGRGFYPNPDGLRLPDDIPLSAADVSVYGFAGEPAVMDPWGNPYVLQIPPHQAFGDSDTNLSASTRFKYARMVSAGPDGVLTVPCFSSGEADARKISWDERGRRLVRQAGRIDGSDLSARGDDIVLFVCRADIDEGEMPGR